MIFRVGPLTLTGGIRLTDGETLAGWGADARPLHGRKDVMFGPVVTTGAHLAFVDRCTSHVIFLLHSANTE